MQIQIERAYSCLAWRVSVTFFIVFSLARGRVGALARLWCCAFTELPAAAMVCLVLSPSCQWMSLACVCGVVLSPSCQRRRAVQFATYELLIESMELSLRCCALVHAC